MLSDAVYQRFEAERNINNLGPNAHKLRRGLTARSGDSVTRRTLGELMLYQFGNEAGLVDFLDNVGEPAFEYGMYPGETARENVAVVPLVRAAVVQGYVFFSLHPSGPEASVVDYVERDLLGTRLRVDYKVQDPQDVKYLWILAAAKFQIDIWLLDQLDTSAIAFLSKSDELLQQGLLNSRNCNGTVVTSCSQHLVRYEVPAGVDYTSQLCDYCGPIVEILQADFCTGTCVGGYDGPYIPGGLIGNQSGGEPGLLGNQGHTPNPGLCNTGAPPWDGQFTSPDLGGGSGVAISEGTWNATMEEGLARAEATMARFGAVRHMNFHGLGSGFATAVSDAIRKSERFDFELNKAIDKYGGAVNCSGTPALEEIAAAAQLAAISGGCQNAIQRIMRDRMEGQEWIDYSQLSQQCPRGANLLIRLQNGGSECFMSTIKKFDNSKTGLVFKVGTCDWNAPGCTSYDAALGVVNINIRPTHCADHCLDLAGTLLHEGVHAVMYKRVVEAGLNPNLVQSYKTLFDRDAYSWAATQTGGNAQHYIMAYSEKVWVDRIAEALWKMNYKYLTKDHYKAIAWDGISQFSPLSTAEIDAKIKLYQQLNTVLRAAPETSNCL